MASVTKRPNGHWRARYRDPTGREHAKHFSRKVDATKWLDSITATIAIGTYVDPAAGQIMLGEYAQTWLARQVPRNPASRVKLPHVRSRDKRFLSHEQVAALADAAGEDHLIIRVLAYCGLRFGELAALRVRDVDPLRRRLHIEVSATEVDGRMVFGTPKSHQCRSVPVPRSLITDLAAVCAGKSPDELVFTAPNGGVLWLRNWRRRVFDPAVAAAGLGQLSPHELRHTAASLAVAAGANVKAVQRTLGHASAAMTLDVYSGLFDDDLDAVADRLDIASQSAGESSRGLSADYLRTDGQLIKLEDWTETSTAQ